MIAALGDHLKLSRPGLWFPTVWLYLLPVAGQPVPLPGAPGALPFWAGLLWATFPLNHLVYGWNDAVDADTDALNPRKDSWLFGARLPADRLARLPRALAAVQLPVWALLVALGGPRVLGLLVAILAVLWAYNHPRRGLRGRPPWDLVSQAGYLLTVMVSATLNGVPLPSPIVFLYLSLFCAQSQLIGEVMDIEPDRAAGRRTTATVLGARHTKTLIIGIVAAEALLVALPLGDPAFGAGLGAFLLWLLLDQLVLFRDGRYSLGQMKLFGLGGNACAVASMAWVWARGGW